MKVFEILEPVMDNYVEEYVPIGQQVRRMAPVLFRRPIGSFIVRISRSGCAKII